MYMYITVVYSGAVFEQQLNNPSVWFPDRLTESAESRVIQGVSVRSNCVDTSGVNLQHTLDHCQTL